jgi:hypothetical protein
MEEKTTDLLIEAVGAVARLLLGRRIGPLRSDRLGRSLEAVAKTVERIGRVATIAASGSSALELSRIHEGGEYFRRAGEWIATCFRLGALDRVPVLFHLSRGRGLGRERGDRFPAALEYVRVTADQLLGDMTRDSRLVTLAPLLQEQR